MQPNENAQVLEPVVPEAEDESLIIDTYDTEALKKALVEERAKKVHWREKANKFKTQIDSTPKPEIKNPKEDNADLQNGVPVDVDSLLDVHESIKDLGRDELSELRTEAKSLGVDPVKYIKSKAGQFHLNMFREEKKTKQGTPAPSNRVPSFNGRPISDIFKDEKATPADKQAAYEAKLRGKGLNQNT